jgi:hypothetical protein
VHVEYILQMVRGRYCLDGCGDVARLFAYLGYRVIQTLGDKTEKPNCTTTERD